MQVTKPLDLTLLVREMATAGVVVNGLGLTVVAPSPETPGDLHTFDAGGHPVDVPPEAGPVVDAHDASRPKRTDAFEQAEDAERLRLVNERARVDRAYAALADLALGKDRPQ